jgi:N-acetylmuramoyl-L-alanine amidase
MVNCVKHGIVQEAPFRVLKLPDIPAVLIETAYVSNPQEERLLKKSDFQKNLAMAISSSIKDYFTGADNAIPGDDEITTTEYKIKKGDTLFSIAGKFKTKVGVLLKLNNMKLEDTVFTGQEIIVPSDKTDMEDEDINKKPSKKTDRFPKREKPSKLYTVEKGETLFMIAKKNSTTLAELLKINNMKITDPLLSGQKIKIP